MSRFKQLWVSFWRKDQGLGMIEAAIILPLFLVITFGVMEFGNMFLQRYQTRDVANDVADYLQANPSASSGDLQTFVTNLGLGTLKKTGPNQDNSVYTKIRIKSERTMMTAAQFDAMCAGADKNWANPWLGGDTADDKNPYYIHVCYPYSYETVTPLSGLTAGAIPATKTMRGKAMAYINTTTGSDGGTPVADISCPSGQMVSGFSGGKPVCGAVPTSGGGGGCSKVPGTVLSDGTVVADACSNLVTTPADASGTSGTFGLYRWQPAMDYCENLTAHGYSDWVLPTMDELRTLYQNRVSIGGFMPFQDSFGNGDFYWSSAQYYSYGAWGMYFGVQVGGVGAEFAKERYYTYRVRCVRKSS